MYGAILGDIIGSPYEFDQGKKTKDFPLFSRESEYTDDTVRMAKNEIDLQIEEMGTALGKKTEAMPLIKEVTLTEDVTEIEVAFDKPIKEFFLVADFAVNLETEATKAIRVRTDGGSQYFAYQTLKVSNQSIRWACYAKEIAEKYWRALFHTNKLNQLQGLSADISTAGMSTSLRKDYLEKRYVNHLLINVADVNILSGSNFKIYGREVEE